MFTEWYVHTNEDKKDENGRFSLDAKLKRTYQELTKHLELEIGFGVGVGQVQEVLDQGLAYTCHFDLLAIQYSDGCWDAGQRFVLSAYASALQPLEVGGGVDVFFEYPHPGTGDHWLGLNRTQDTVTIVSYANYSYFVGGNIHIGFDIANFILTMCETWR